MRDRPIIFAGLAVFLALVTLPIWYNALAGTRAAGPALKLPPTGEQCVLPAAEMKAAHMRLLISWRDRVVREGAREFQSADGRKFDMSLLRTCLAQCHQQREQFCDRCHAYSGIQTVSCWNCHNGQPATLRSAR